MLVRRRADEFEANYKRQISPIGAYRSYWKNYTNFRDRSSRAGYWWVVLINFLIAIGLFINMYIAISGSGGSFSDFLISVRTIAPIVIFVAWPFVNVIPGLALTVRRLHDTGRSWLYYLLAIIPVVGFIIMLIFLTSYTKPPYENKYSNRPQV